MATNILTDDLVVKLGDLVDLGSSAGTVTSGAISIAGDTVDLTLSDDAPTASLMIEVGFETAPALGGYIDVFLVPQNIEGTNDIDPPTTTFQGTTHVASIPVLPQTAVQRQRIDIDPGIFETGGVYKPWIINRTNQTMSSGWKLWPRPKTLGPL